MGFPDDGHLGLRQEVPIGSAKSIESPGKVSSRSRSATSMCRFRRFEIAKAVDGGDDGGGMEGCC